MDNYITDYNVSNPNAVALEDCIMKKDGLTTAGSKMLENFVAPFDATVVDRLRNAGIPISGKTRMLEFGISGFFDDKPEELSGSVQVVVENSVRYCLCNDVFGMYRRQAAENGLCYIHPTYGTVSRYGLIPLASSMDQIGVLCKNMADGFSLLSVIAGHDPNDGAMFPEQNYHYQRAEKDMTVCVPSAIVNQTDERTRNAIRAFAERFAVVDDSPEYFDVYQPTMTILSCAEISNNISRYDGIKFGYRAPNSPNLESLYTKTRTEAFGLDAKLAAIMGAMVLSHEHYDAWYAQAMKIRRLIKQSLRFDKYDVIALPIGGHGVTALPLLAGLPSVSFTYQGCGIQLTANVKNENALLTVYEVLLS